MKKGKILVLGSGPYAIGSSVEFDWCSVNVVKTLRKEGFETIVLNSNPETVSTDFNECDKLYFEELSLERVLDIIEHEKPDGVIVSTGGQIPNNLALPLYERGVKILGTSPENIDRAEDRHKFSSLLDKLKIDQPKWNEFRKIEEAYKFAEKVGYPVLVRPSFVLSGAAMSVAETPKDLKRFLEKAVDRRIKNKIVISKFEENAKEIEFDAVAHKGEIIIYAISEHVENAGVHSGDATIVFPPQRLFIETIRRVKKIARTLAKELDITGPFNIQFLAKENRIKVIELNLRASRSFPFVSKVSKENFIEIATLAMIGKPKFKDYKTLDLDYVGVKSPQFSFSRLRGADPILGVEMASTGEVACFGETQEEAFLKSMISVGFKIPGKNILLSTGPVESKADFLKSAETLQKMGYKFFGTGGTSDFLKKNGIKCTQLARPSESFKPSILDYLTSKKIDLVINVPKNRTRTELTDGYTIRRTAVDMQIPLINNIQVAKLFVSAIKKYKLEDLKIMSFCEYKK